MEESDNFQWEEAKEEEGVTEEINIIQGPNNQSRLYKPIKVDFIE